jgi:hypothetical protein
MPGTARKLKPETADSTAPAAPALPSLDAMETAEASLADIRRAPNPYKGIALRDDVKDSERPKRFAGLDKDTAHKVKLLIQRDARENGLGCSIAETQDENGTWSVTFRTSSKKRTFSATSADIRAWAKEQNPPLPTEVGKTTKNGKEVFSSAIPRDTRDAYRVAHNLPVSKRD